MTPCYSGLPKKVSSLTLSVRFKTYLEFEAENEFKMNQQSIVLIAEPKQVEQVEVTQPVTEASTTQPAIVSKPTNNETGNSSIWAKF